MEIIPDDNGCNEIGNDVQKVEETIHSNESNVVSSSGLSVTEGTTATAGADGNVTTTTETESKPALPLLVPSLKGKMTFEGGNVTCKGVWGMSDLAHTQPGQTSDFEFKLVKADEGSPIFPVNGRYHGWFHLKQAAPLKGSLKIEDKEMTIQFTRTEGETHYRINGNGVNKFGSFTLKGTLSEDGDLHVYREYYNLTPPPVNLKRRMSIDGAEATSSAKKAKPLALKTEEGVPPPPEVSISPREGTGRIRKQSSLMKEYIDTTVKAPPSVPKPGTTPRAEKEVSKAKALAPLAVQPPLMRQESTSDRAHRISHPLKKCAELLKELAKHPHAAWFLEPVDHVRLGIPDYPLIISQPMDFSTIRKKIESNVYDAIEGFAEDMRLVFRNAVTFNTQRDNPVHIAAREMSVRFEERFRVLTSQLGGTNAYSAAAILALEAGKGSSSSAKKGQSSKTPRNSLGGGFAKPSGGVGPRVSSSGNLPFLPPAIDGSSAHQLMEMQRMMQAMQNEISSLKSQVRENEIVKRLQETKDASHNPLTFEEKKTLIAQVHKLPSDKMAHVLNIIQSALPPRENDEDGDIEVPLDALDTFTLRKLQKFIEENAEKKKRAPPSAQRHSSAGAALGGSGGGGAGGAPKRARKSVSTSRVDSLMGGGVEFGHGELDLFESSEDMLFEPDSFEELKAHAQRDAASRSDSAVAAADLGDDVDFSALATMQPQSQSGGDAWK